MAELLITKDRWDKLVYVTERGLNGCRYALEEDLWEFSSEERMLLITVLKNNVPFEVIESMRKNIKDKGIENKQIDVVEKY